MTEEKLIPKNYMAEVYIKLGTRKVHRKFFSVPELKNILAGFKKFSEKLCYPPIYFMTHTGCKGREALNLKWVDVDTTAGTVFFPSTSNANGRVIHLSPYILGFLKKHPRIHENVFLNEEHNPWTVDTFYKRMASDRTAMDLGSDWDKFSFRHTFAYHFLRQGRTIQQLQVVLGHRYIQQTIDFYGDIVSREEQKTSPYQEPEKTAC